MYIEINQDKECSKCSAVNNYETVWRGNEHIIRCRICNHEKVIATITTSLTNTNNPIVYQAKEMPTKIKF